MAVAREGTAAQPKPSDGKPAASVRSCPKCGAPLPRTDDNVVECSYCKAPVQLPAREDGAAFKPHTIWLLFKPTTMRGCLTGVLCVIGLIAGASVWIEEGWQLGVAILGASVALGVFSLWRILTEPVYSL